MESAFVYRKVASDVPNLKILKFGKLSKENTNQIMDMMFDLTKLVIHMRFKSRICLTIVLECAAWKMIPENHMASISSLFTTMVITVFFCDNIHLRTERKF